MLHLSQRSAPWATVKIGNTQLPLGRWGCTITSISMLSSFFGCYLTPAQIARTPGLFDSQGRIIWGNIDKLFKGKLKFVKRVGGHGKAVFDRKSINDSLINSPKTAVILEVANFSHWVVVVSTYGNDYYIIDPIDAGKKLCLKSQGNITGSAHFISG